MSILSEVLRGIFRGHILGYKGSEENRQRTQAARFSGEIHSTVVEEIPDNPRAEVPSRLFAKNVLMSAGKWHGLVADEAAMLALNTTSPYKCRPMDWCRRVDTGHNMMCVTNEGTALSDWIEFETSASTSGHWQVVTNGDPDSPEVVFADGDVVEVFVTE